jgi:hypothetical protein
MAGKASRIAAAWLVVSGPVEAPLARRLQVCPRRLPQLGRGAGAKLHLPVDRHDLGVEVPLTIPGAATPVGGHSSRGRRGVGRSGQKAGAHHAFVAHTREPDRLGRRS